MKTEEDEAFDDLAKKQGAWGGGFKAKQAMAADKLQEPVHSVQSNGRHSPLLTHMMNKMNKRTAAQPAQEPDWKTMPPKDAPLVQWVKEQTAPPQPAQPMQEPVAWRRREVGGCWQYFGWEETGMTYQVVERWNKNGFECEAIPAIPPQPVQEPVREARKLGLDYYVPCCTNQTCPKCKAALAQPAQESYDQTALELCNVCGWKTLIPDDGCLNCERAQPAQEPVAKPYAYEYGRCNADGTYSVVIEKGDLVQTMPAVFNYVRPRNACKDWPIKELFAAPPQREWADLTYEDWKKIEDMPDTFYQGVAWAQAKLKEKNG